MAQQEKSFTMETASIPVFYKNFHCLANKCRDSCCVGWKIHFDKKDYLRLRRLEAPAELREKLSKGVRRERGKMASDKVYGHFDLEDNEDRCPFWGADGLCEIQAACGHDALPFVCTSYPRRIMHSPTAKLYTLSPSCEGMLEQLWELPDGVKFVEEPLPKAERRTVKIVPGENLMEYHAPIRRVVLGILQNRALTLAERMLHLGLAVQHLQKEDWSHFDPDKWGQQTAALAGMIKETFGRIAGNRELYLVQNLKVLGEIGKSQKKEDWVDEVYEALEVQRILGVATDESGGEEQTLRLRMTFSPERYDQALAEFEEAFFGQDYFFENLMVAVALYLDFPALTGSEELWKGFVSLCNLYSFYRFITVVGCKGQTTKERLFHVIAMSSRSVLHNRNRFQGFQEELFQNDSSTLAHMAILLKG